MGSIFNIITGLSTGMLSGSAIAAFYLAIGIFSRLGDKNFRLSYRLLFFCAAAGVALGNCVYLFGWHLHGLVALDILSGLCSGIFTGIYIACLAEVFNIIPFFRVLNIKKIYIEIILLGFALGKTAGSLVYWLSGLFK
jgi:stage V sporulation protein AB